MSERDGVSGNPGSVSVERLPPGPTAPGALQTLRWMFRPIELMERCRRRYGDVFSMQLGPSRVVMIAEPEAAKETLNGNPAIFRAGDTNGLFRPVVGSHSILLLDGDEHMRQRRILLPAFGAAHGQQFEEQVREITERRVSSWEPGQRLRLQDEMEAISFESIMGVVFGGDEGPGRERLRELIPEMMDRCDSPFTLIPWFRRGAAGMTPYSRLMRVIDKVDAVLYDTIAERRADPMTQLRDDALSLLLQATYEDGRPLSDREIRDQLLTMIMAGYETTTSALAWSLERLLHTPAVLEQVRTDFETGDERYLDGVVKEALRIRPVVPVVARRLTEPATVCGYTIPAGTILMVSIYLAHNDPRTYPEPEEFRPERFLAGVPEGAAWIPFGGGVRRCLGASFAQLEMRVVLREVLSAVRLRAGSPSAEHPRRKRFTFAPADGAQAVVEDRVPRSTGLGSRRFKAPAPRGPVRA
jgi:cytochrome P450